jgi:hypothetical protein
MEFKCLRETVWIMQSKIHVTKIVCVQDKST